MSDVEFSQPDDTAAGFFFSGQPAGLPKPAHRPDTRPSGFDKKAGQRVRLA